MFRAKVLLCLLYVAVLLESTKPCSLDKEIQHTDIMVCILLNVVHLTCEVK